MTRFLQKKLLVNSLVKHFSLTHRPIPAEWRILKPPECEGNPGHCGVGCQKGSANAIKLSHHDELSSLALLLYLARCIVSLILNDVTIPSHLHSLSNKGNDG